MVSDSVRPHRRQPTRLPCPWDSPGKNTGVGCHFLLQCMKVKSEREVTRLCPTRLLKFSRKLRIVIFSIQSSPEPSVIFGAECYCPIIFFTESTNTLTLAAQLPQHRIFSKPACDAHSSGARALAMLNQAARYCTLKY